MEVFGKYVSVIVSGLNALRLDGPITIGEYFLIGAAGLAAIGLGVDGLTQMGVSATLKKVTEKIHEQVINMPPHGEA